MSKVPPPKGTRDFYPDEMAIHNWICDSWKEISQRNGFVQYDGPIFEYLQLYTQKSGDEIASQLFSLTDRGGRELAIRPEMTPTLARMVNQKINALPRPIKWFSIPRLCRAERPQKGRLREFYQWNIDIIGSDHLLADAESIFTAVDYLKSVGLLSSDIEVRLSSRSMIAAVLIDLGFDANNLDPIYVLLDKRAKVSIEAFSEMVTEAIPDKALAEKLMQLQGVTTLDEVATMATGDDAKKGIDELRQLFSYIADMGIGDYVVFDIKIVRGLAYYTGPVFEIFDKKTPLRALCGGGRYDNLLAGLGGQSVPATGFGMGDVVLEILLEERGLLNINKSTLDTYIFAMDASLTSKSLQIASQLRAARWHTTLSYKQIGIGKQFKQATNLGAACCVILGEETMTDNKVTIKHLASGEQKTMQLTTLMSDCPSKTNISFFEAI